MHKTREIVSKSPLAHLELPSIQAALTALTALTLAERVGAKVRLRQDMVWGACKRKMGCMGSFLTRVRRGVGSGEKDDGVAGDGAVFAEGVDLFVGFGFDVDLVEGAVEVLGEVAADGLLVGA